MSNPTTTSRRHTAPIKLLGARRAFVSLGYGAILGPAVGAVVSVLFLPAATTEALRTGLLMMSLLFGLIFGPLLTLLTASMLAVAAAGFSRADFLAVGWAKLAMVAVVACALGIAIGFVVGAAVGPSGAITFLFAMIGGILGALVPGAVLVRNAARRRLASVVDEGERQAEIARTPISANAAAPPDSDTSAGAAAASVMAATAKTDTTLGLADPSHVARAEIEEAASMVDRIIRLGPSVLSTSTAEVLELVAVLDRALVKAPGDVDLLLAKSGAFAFALQFKSAEEVLDEVLARDPAHFHAQQLKRHSESWRHVFYFPSWSSTATKLHPQMAERLAQNQSLQLVRDGLQIGLAVVRAVSQHDFPTPLSNAMTSKWEPVWSDTPAGPIIAHYLVLADNPSDPFRAEAILPLLGGDPPTPMSGYWLAQLLPALSSCFCVFSIGGDVIYNRRYVFPPALREQLKAMSAKAAKQGPSDDASRIARAAQWHAEHFDMARISI